ncbi:MAG: trypsin-like peptidase domain-containing protein, partial [Dehalococcoidales bacterium]
PSVVAINTEVETYDIFRRAYTQEGAGSGWIIDEDGYIVTNNHVIEGAKSITATLADGRTFQASVVGTDALADLAVLKIDARNLVEANLGDSAKVRVGEWVLVVGNPLGLGISAKEGIIGRVAVSIPISAGQTLDDLIEISAAINPGNSGGPLVNMRGEVIGITSVKISAVGVEGIGYAISIDSAKPIVQQLVQQGYVIRPYLGISYGDVSQTLVWRYDLAVANGVFVGEVVPGYPADEAGLKAKDVIVSFNGKEITNMEDLRQEIISCRIGQRVEIIYWRGNAEKTTYATLTECPAPD